MAEILEIVLEICRLFFTMFIIILDKISKLISPTSFYKDVKNDVALITGGGSGIGRLTAIKLSQAGASIIVVDIDSVQGEETVKMIKENGGKAKFFYCDVTKSEDVRSVSSQISQNGETVTILINNAGIVSGSSLSSMNEDMILRVFKVNVLSHFSTIKAFLPGMVKERRGHIVSVASLAGYVGLNKMTDYSSSKFAVVGLDEALRAELKSMSWDFIQCTLVCPYFINTGMFEGVRSKFLPILSQDFVTEKIVNGILANEDSIILPWYASYLLILKQMVPTKVSIQLYNAIGLLDSMINFNGNK